MSEGRKHSFKRCDTYKERRKSQLKHMFTNGSSKEGNHFDSPKDASPCQGAVFKKSQFANDIDNIKVLIKDIFANQIVNNEESDEISQPESSSSSEIVEESTEYSWKSLESGEVIYLDDIFVEMLSSKETDDNFILQDQISLFKKAVVFNQRSKNEEMRSLSNIKLDYSKLFSQTKLKFQVSDVDGTAEKDKFSQQLFSYNLSNLHNKKRSQTLHTHITSFKKSFKSATQLSDYSQLVVLFATCQVFCNQKTEAVKVAERYGLKTGDEALKLANVHKLMGIVRLLDGDLEEAILCTEKAIGSFEEGGSKIGQVQGYLMKAYLEMRVGREWSFLSRSEVNEGICNKGKRFIDALFILFKLITIM
jgi:hypothetical protein